MSLNTKKTSNKLKYSYCNRIGHIDSKCYKKYPNLAPSKSIKNINLVNKEQVVEIEETILSTTKSTSIDNTIDFILDSSATIHTCYIKELFTSIKPTNTTIK